ncbi:MAG: M23 family metallopeptidase, partial [Candidatus Dadabacteria bacterium]
TIKVINVPRGIGLIPVSLELKVEDYLSGINYIKVEAQQPSGTHLLLEKQFLSFKGSNKKRRKKKADLRLVFDRDKTELDEGEVKIVATVKDNSLFRNTSSVVIPLYVDYREPVLKVFQEPLTSEGTPYLLFYKAVDENLSASGVKVGQRVFLGAPSQYFDPTIKAPDVYGVIFAPPLGASSAIIKVFAEDRAGNTKSISFYNRIRKVRQRIVNKTLQEDFLRITVSRLARDFLILLKRRYSKENKVFKYTTKPGTIERLLEKFMIVNERFSQVSEQAVSEYLKKGVRFERFWKEPFDPPSNAFTIQFGDKIAYLYGNLVVSSRVSKGMFFATAANSEVYALLGGMVLFSDNIGTYGRTIAIDHGLGVVSIYANLSSAAVKEGDVVTRGQLIGLSGQSGLSSETGYYLEVRVGSVAVNPSLWWNSSWFNTQIKKPIREVKNIFSK